MDDALARSQRIAQTRSAYREAVVCFEQALGALGTDLATGTFYNYFPDKEAVFRAVVREVVIATNATTTGEATALHLADALHERAPEVAVTRLASGLPVGSDLEYADEITLGRALRGRQAL